MKGQTVFGLYRYNGRALFKGGGEGEGWREGEPGGGEGCVSRLEGCVVRAPRMCGGGLASGEEQGH